MKGISGSTSDSRRKCSDVGSVSWSFLVTQAEEVYLKNAKAKWYLALRAAVYEKHQVVRSNQNLHTPPLT